MFQKVASGGTPAAWSSVHGPHFQHCFKEARGRGTRVQAETHLQRQHLNFPPSEVHFPD